MNELNNLLCAAFSPEKNAWCVYKKETEATMRLMWPCHNEAAAIKLADEINNGAVTCRGCKALGTACGKCVRCELST